MDTNIKRIIISDESCFVFWPTFEHQKGEDGHDDEVLDIISKSVERLRSHNIDVDDMWIAMQQSKTYKEIALTFTSNPDRVGLLSENDLFDDNIGSYWSRVSELI